MKLECLRVFIDETSPTLALEKTKDFLLELNVIPTEISLNPYYKIKEWYEINLVFPEVNLKEIMLKTFSGDWKPNYIDDMINSNPKNDKISYVKWISYQTFDDSVRIV
jgi:hypothetical protein